MAFTQAQLQTSLNTAVSGAGCQIVKFGYVDGLVTDVTVQNLNTSARKTGTAQLLQSRTADQAAGDLLTAIQ